MEMETETKPEMTAEVLPEAQASQEIPAQERIGNRPKYKKKFHDWLAFLQHYAPYGLLLLLAPQVERNIVFYYGGQAWFQLPYWAILAAVALPLAAVYVWLRPIGDQPLFRFAALLLPMQFFFMLQFSARTSPMIAIGLIAACVAYAIICRIVILRKCTRTPSKMHEDDECHKLTKTHRRRVLCQAVPFAAGLLLVFSIMGALPERAPTDPGLFTAEAAFLPAATQPVDRLQMISPARWGGLTQRERREALQALLNAETRALNIAPIRLDDEAIFEVQSRQGISIRRALRSGRNQAEARIRAVSFAAYYHRLAQNSALNPTDFDAQATAYAERRVAHYMALLDAREPQGEQYEDA